MGRADSATVQRRRTVAVAILVAALLSVGAALAVALPGDIPDEPGIVDVAEFALRDATEPAPPRSRSRRSLLDTGRDGPVHPYWEREPGWRATGAREDSLAQGSALTVFYERDGRRVGYSIVEGPRLPPPVATTDEIVGGVRLRSFLAEDRAIVTWLRGGSTCVLSGEGVGARVLLDLAATGLGGPARSVGD